MVVIRCDVTVANDVTDALFKAGLSGAGLHPVRGIVHAACAPQGAADNPGREEDDAVLPAATAEQVAEKHFMEAKVRGAGGQGGGALRRWEVVGWCSTFWPKKDSSDRSASLTLYIVGTPLLMVFLVLMLYFEV